MSQLISGWGWIVRNGVSNVNHSQDLSYEPGKFLEPIALSRFCCVFQVNIANVVQIFVRNSVFAAKFFVKPLLFLTISFYFDNLAFHEQGDLLGKRLLARRWECSRMVR